MKVYVVSYKVFFVMYAIFVQGSSEWLTIECSYYNHQGRCYDKSSNDNNRNDRAANNDWNDDYRSGNDNSWTDDNTDNYNIRYVKKRTVAEIFRV